MSIGKPITRREDVRFLTGAARFIDDIELPGLLYAGFLRSPYPHARIKKMDAKRAEEHPDCLEVLTGEEVRNITKPVRNFVYEPSTDYCLAVDKVRYVGEPVAAVAVKDMLRLEEVLELFDAEYEPLAPVVDVRKAIEINAPLLYEEVGTNVLWHDTFSYGNIEDAFLRADHIFKESYSIHRYTSTPLETAGCIAQYDEPSKSLTVYSNHQIPGMLIMSLSNSLGIPTNRIRLIIVDIGGGFGVKISGVKYMVSSALLSMKTGHPIKWIEDRQGHMMASGHACSGTFDIRVATTKDGEITALKLWDINDEGATMAFGGLHTITKLSSINGCYRIPNVVLEAFSVVTNKCPSVPNRGVGKPAMCMILEVTINRIARALNLDPLEVRLRNYIKKDEFPFVTPTGQTYDSGDYAQTLQKAMDMVDYRKFRKEQEELLRQGRYVGLGISTDIEPGDVNLAQSAVVTHKVTASGAHEGATVRVNPDGTVLVIRGATGMGQGHETTIVQVVSDILGVDPDSVNVMPYFDSAISPWTPFSGTFANRFTGAEIGAVVGAATKVREKAIEIAAHLLEARTEDVVVKDGKFQVAGSPSVFKTYMDIAVAAYRNTGLLPSGMEPGLQVTFYHNNPIAKPPDKERRHTQQLNHANAAHIALVEVDTETGHVKILRYIVVADCGRILNPLIAEGQVHGATQHGISAALMEGFFYSEDGQLLTRTFMDYLKPTAVDFPAIEVAHIETPSPHTVFGQKGLGEGGAILAPAAIVNAVEDALAPFAVKIDNLPITPEYLHTKINEARSRPNH